MLVGLYFFKKNIESFCLFILQQRLMAKGKVAEEKNILCRIGKENLYHQVSKRILMKRRGSIIYELKTKENR